MPVPLPAGIPTSAFGLKIPSHLPKRRCAAAFQVAQIFNLPYRRIAFCGAFAIANRFPYLKALPITNRRYSGGHAVGLKAIYENAA
jgi:hypothetical protein